MMKQFALAAVFTACVVVPTLAQQSATGGPSGAPNQSQAVVPEGATGGRSGGPNQSQAVVSEGARGGRSGGPNQSQAVVKKKSRKKMHH